jgi:uncharacterized membrane protein YdbT with pleckstrin-like domain
MSYIDQNLLVNEKIIFRTKKHKIIFFYPTILVLFAVYAAAYMESNPFLAQIVFVPWVVVLIYFASVSLQYWTSEFVLTDKRILMREGFFYRHTNETRLSAISQINIDQSLLGQILSYGSVTILAFGAHDVFTVVDRAIPFQKAVNQQLDFIHS